MTETTSPLTGLLDGTPRIVTAGVELFETSLRSQGVEPVTVDWRPPADDLADDLARLAADPRTADA
ncbi:MAG: hypothetical protein KG028_00400, partial [Actinobacteria bacterium]|nr:hypothetical protein [Actinomycetota bacterium]